MKPWLWLPASWAHDLSPLVLRLHGRFCPLKTLTWRPFTWRGLEFTNPLGIAGGVDKNANHVNDWWTYGPGFVEVGTVTPRAQSANPGSTLARSTKHKALWNRMGFPNKGLNYVVAQLNQLYRPHFTPVFVNIGKNRVTPLQEAHQDYIQCIQKLAGLADVFVINISSPNTEGLRSLLLPENLTSFLKPIVDANQEARGPNGLDRPTPLLLKLSPDVTEDELKSILDISLELKVDGWILTNTTASIREGLPFPAEGGVSGAPLAARSRELLLQAVKWLGPRREGKLVVSTGGILSAQDVKDRLDHGADLVQVYTALAYEGPSFFARTIEQFV